MAINIIIHYPEKADGIADLQKSLAAIHARTAVEQIQKLPTTKKQKLEVLHSMQHNLRSTTKKPAKD